MNDLLRRTESILDVALSADHSDGKAIVLDRAGRLRVLSIEGWTLSGLIQEYGAGEVYMVKTCAGTITVEGWSPTDRCTIEKKRIRPVFADLPPNHSAGYYAARSQVTPQLAS